jgi:hypothetical protein
MSAYLTSRIAKNITAATFAVAAIGIAGAVPANADTRTNCSGYTIVDNPAEHEPQHAPVHHGQIALSISRTGAPLVIGSAWEFTMNEYNGTGAAYRNVAPSPDFMGWTEVAPNRLGGMTPKNTHLQALVDGAWRNVPLATGCDPAISVNSTMLNHPLAAGAHWSTRFRLTVDASVTPKLASFQFLQGAAADGAWFWTSAGPDVKIVRPAVRPTSTPSTSSSRPATPGHETTPGTNPGHSGSTSGAATGTSGASSDPQLARTGTTGSAAVAAAGAGLLALGGLACAFAVRLHGGRRS